MERTESLLAALPLVRASPTYNQFGNPRPTGVGALLGTKRLGARDAAGA
jgi:hypothetical protein